MALYVVIWYHLFQYAVLNGHLLNWPPGIRALYTTGSPGLQPMFHSLCHAATGEGVACTILRAALCPSTAPHCNTNSIKCANLDTKNMNLYKQRCMCYFV